MNLQCGVLSLCELIKASMCCLSYVLCRESAPAEMLPGATHICFYGGIALYFMYSFFILRLWKSRKEQQRHLLIVSITSISTTAAVLFLFGFFLVIYQRVAVI
ncbi:MAG: hypothetical protein IJR99_01400 [Kiritimatiellae bacterium]|nr:hypothetical protein [Kiritimatiellia bacterium]